MQRVPIINNICIIYFIILLFIYYRNLDLIKSNSLFIKFRHINKNELIYK